MTEKDKAALKPDARQLLEELTNLASTYAPPVCYNFIHQASARIEATLAPAVVEPVASGETANTERKNASDYWARHNAPEPEKAQGDDPVGYKYANQLKRWRVLRGTEYETAERCYMFWSKEPLKIDISDCCVPVYLKPLTERREPPADLSLDAMKALKRLEDGKIYDDYDDEDIEENVKAIETIRQALKGRISGVSKEGEE